MKLSSIFVTLNLFLGLFSVSALATSNQTSGHPGYLAAVVEVDGDIEVWINPKAFWLEHGFLTASYTEEEMADIQRIVDDAVLCGLAESMYEPCGPQRSTEKLKQDLLAAALELNADFQKWAEEEL